MSGSAHDDDDNDDGHCWREEGQREQLLRVYED